MAMGQNISPGVYTRIIDLSEYLADIPGTIGFLPILSKRGPDNKLMFVTSKEQFINTYGEPNILDYGKYYSQGPYVAYQHLGVSSHLYVLRALPNDATYAHIMIGMQIVDEAINYEFSSSSGNINQNVLKMQPIYFDGQEHDDASGDPFTAPTVNLVQDLETRFSLPQEPLDYMYPAVTGGTGVPDGWLLYLRAIGRGDSYNDFSIRLSAHSNNELFGVYILDIFETQSDGDSIVVESFNVSIDPDMVDDTGESLFIEDVVNKFSSYLRCAVNPAALDRLFMPQSPGGESYMMAFYKNDPTLPEDISEVYTVLDGNGQATDLGYKATVIEIARLDYDYTVSVLDEALDDLTTARALPTSTSSEIIVRNTAVAAAIEDVSAARLMVSEARLNLEDAYLLDIFDIGDAIPATAAVDPWPLTEGSEGSLVYENQSSGKTSVDTEVATQTLVEAYLGLLQKPDAPVPSSGIPKKLFVDEVYDLDWIYFSLVYDAGYVDDVKQAAKTLVDVYRRDCMLISDCGDNVDYDDVNTYVGGDPDAPTGISWNSRYAARYEPYSRVYDVFTGRDLWLSPVYHMAQIIPLNDRLYELWYAPAGFNRATLSAVKELRWSAKLGERDQLYLKQVNPIVHFPEGYTVWGQLTTQKRPTSLQDLNVMRLVLYIKRALEQYCKYFIFEFNDNVTHDQIKSGIIPFLDRIKARRGLVDFSVDVGADEYEFKNKICHVNVILQPMKIIEKIELNLFVK